MATSDSQPAFPPNFTAFANAALAHHHVPGLAVAVIRGTGIETQCFGYARLPSSQIGSAAGKASNTEEQDDGVKVSETTLFDIASMSKSFTASAVALGVQEGKEVGVKGEKKKVKWETRMTDVLEGFGEGKGHIEEATLEDCLSHRTGLGCHDESYHGINSPTPSTPESILANLPNLPMSSSPCTKFQYCNMLYTVSALAASAIHSTPFPTLLHDRFWTPLGMHNTYLGVERIPSSEKPNMAHSYAWDPVTQQQLARPHIPEPEAIGNGSIQSTILDVARWVSAQITRAPPLTDDSYTALTTPRILASASTSAPRLSAEFYALGWEVSWYRGYQIVRHDGSWSGFVGGMMYVPALEWGVVTLGNSKSAGRAETEVEWALVDEVLGVPEAERFNWRGNGERAKAEWEKENSPAGVFPEMEGEREKESQKEVRLELLAGKYWNKGYGELDLKYNAEKEQLEADWTKRSDPFWLVVRHRAYGLWFAAENVDPVVGDSIFLRSRFEVDAEGRGNRFVVQFDEDCGMIEFERVES